ncbi:MAG: hypothetical protein E7271_01790 [Lachnospiraceae bacterium]|jgi:transketolase|nr:hypothetical protein [Lachnospiraceae bacterium]
MDITSVNIRKWSMLGQRGTAFGVAMPDIASKLDNVKLLTADLALLSGMDRYVSMYPDKFLNVGIAEQNMIGIAAGLAMEGDVVFATTYASFIAVRSLEHVRQHLSYLKCNVKLIGSSAGVVAAKSGVSHWATEDIAFMRALPNLKVFSPADCLETIKVMEYAASTDEPMYIRLSGGLNCPIVYRADYEFEPGKMVCLSEKKGDIAVIATGLLVSEAVKAVKELEEKGVNCTLYNMHTIKPLDTDTLDEIFKTHKLVVTVEEHNVVGGMGSAVAEYKATKEVSPRQVFIGFNDSFLDAGSQRYVLEQAGLTHEKIAWRIEVEWENRA